MINGKSVLAIIPARGGSKGLPNKNILPLGDHPLIAWSINAANKSKYVDRCIISTDEKNIALISKQYGGEVPFLRPPQLSSDTANSKDVILHAIQTIKEKYNIIILLQPTSPLRNSIDIDKALELMEQKNANALVSMVSLKHPIEWTSRLTSDLHIPDLINFSSKKTRRQDFQERFELNGAIYISNSEAFINEETFITNETIAYIMPPERSIDIDNKFDYDLATFLLKKNSDNKMGIIK